MHLFIPQILAELPLGPWAVVAPGNLTENHTYRTCPCLEEEMGIGEVVTA